MTRLGVPAAAVVGVVAAVWVNPGLVDIFPVVRDVPVLGELVSDVADARDTGGPSKHKPGKTTSGDESRGGADTDPTDGISPRYLTLYKKAAADSCVSWRVLAAIGYVESRHGANTGPSSAGALGPMQFMPDTWKAYGRDGDGDGRKNIHDPADAIPATAGYLCANGATTNLHSAKLRTAIWHYNHSWSYVDQVLAVADRLR